MKRWALPVSLAVALSATTATAFAETQPIATNFRGHFKSALQYNSSDVNKKVIDGKGNPVEVYNSDGTYHLPTSAFGAVDVDLRGDIILSPNANNRFVLELRQRIRGDKLLDAFPTRFYSASQSARFGGGASGQDFKPGTGDLVDKAYLENKSEWWEGGPTITTRIGRQDPNFNPWVAKVSRFDRAGVTIQGVKIGPADIKFGYIWGGNHDLLRTRTMSSTKSGDDEILADPGSTNDDKVWHQSEGIQSAVVAMNFGLDVLDLDLAAVRTATKGNDAVMDYAVGLAVPLGDAAKLEGAYARDGLNEKNAYNVKVSTQWGAANLWGRYRKVEQGFSPIYEDRDDFMNPEKRSESNVHDERTGFEVGASGEVYNWRLAGSYDSSYREWLGFGDDEKISTVRLSAGTQFQANNPVDFSVSAVIENSDEKSGAKYVQDSRGALKGTDRDPATLYRVGQKADKTTITAGLGTNFDIVRATYELKLTDDKSKAEKMTDHTLALSAPIKVAYLDTLHVGASIQLRNGMTKDANKERADTGYGIDLAWQGKNGLRFGVHYTDGYDGKLSNRQYNVKDSGETNVVVKNADPDYLRKYTYPDGTTHYLGNGLAVTAGWGISF